MPPSPNSYNIDDHKITLQQLCTRYETYINETEPSKSLGLNYEQVERLKVEFGPNVLSPPKSDHPFVKFLSCLLAVFNLLLMVAGILTLVLYFMDPKINYSDLYLGIALILVAFINAVIEFFQLQKSASLLKSFLKLVPQLCHVVRFNTVTQIAASEIVVGDVILVRMGDKVPADFRIFAATDFKVDNSSLTGESDPQERTPDNSENNPLEATNLAFSGTLVVSGEAYGVVIRTGDSTLLGQIATLTSEETKNASPLSSEISEFIQIIACLATFTAFFFFFISLVRYQEIHISLNFAIGTFVAFIPEGLPVTVTMMLMVAAKRMAHQKVLVKDLQGVETLGAITLLATDKTGTLTRNEMTVANIWTNLFLHETLIHFNLSEAESEKGFEGVHQMILISSLNSQVKYDRTDLPFEERCLFGDATEIGLAKFSQQHHPDFDQLASLYPKVFEIPFNSENKWALSIHKLNHPSGSLTMFVKGAPERILVLCSKLLFDGAAIPLKTQHIDQFKEAYETMAGKGHRVIAFAQLGLNGDVYSEDYVFNIKNFNFPLKDLTFVGLASLEDPPKHGVREAIGRCRSAGIRVMMVTGDHPLTAEAIARKINLMICDTKKMVSQKTMRSIDDINENEYDAIVMHGEQLDDLDDEEWDQIFSKQEIIFARTSPRQKLEIVKRAQSLGHIVGVTGDGINDAPALKKADLGIAMSQSGSDVSKEAAGMILLDDNFASIVRGIAEGRLIFSNLKTSIRYTITHSLPEILPQLLFVLVPIPLPLPSILILFIDLGFELVSALSYAWDPPETSTGLMKLSPRKPVNSASVSKLRRTMARELLPVYDLESRTFKPPSRLQTILHNFRLRFSLGYWKDKLSPSDEQVLVDRGLLSWSYFEAGLIETLVCLAAFFGTFHTHNVTIHDSHIMQVRGYFKSGKDAYISANGTELSDLKQLEALSQAQSAYFLSLLIMQSFNLFVCKSRLRGPWGRHMFRNWRNFAGIGFGLCLGLMIVYVPELSKVFLTSPNLNPTFGLAVPFLGGLILLTYGTIRHWILSKAKPALFTPEIVGLQMQPTVYTKYNRL